MKAARSPLGALSCGGAAEGANVDPLGGAPLLSLCGGAAAVQAPVVRLSVGRQAASQHGAPFDICNSSGENVGGSEIQGEGWIHVWCLPP